MQLTHVQLNEGVFNARAMTIDAIRAVPKVGQ